MIARLVGQLGFIIWREAIQDTWHISRPAPSVFKFLICLNLLNVSAFTLYFWKT